MPRAGELPGAVCLSVSCPREIGCLPMIGLGETSSEGSRQPAIRGPLIYGPAEADFRLAEGSKADTALASHDPHEP